MHVVSEAILECSSKPSERYKTYDDETNDFKMSIRAVSDETYETSSSLPTSPFKQSVKRDVRDETNDFSMSAVADGCDDEE